MSQNMTFSFFIQYLIDCGCKSSALKLDMQHYDIINTKQLHNFPFHTSYSCHFISHHHHDTNHHNIRITCCNCELYAETMHCYQNVQNA